jgi:RHS repeat-associated protein
VLTETTPANGDRFKYTAREWDSDIGLQYNRARYYDPKAGRWTSEDPTGFRAGDANLYRYVRNSPLLMLDPTGLRILSPAECWTNFVAETARCAKLPTALERKQCQLKALRKLAECMRPWNELLRYAVNMSLVAANLIMTGAVLSVAVPGVGTPVGVAVATIGVGVAATAYLMLPYLNQNGVYSRIRMNPGWMDDLDNYTVANAAASPALQRQLQVPGSAQG